MIIIIIENKTIVITTYPIQPSLEGTQLLMVDIRGK